MLAGLRENYVNVLTSGAHLLILAVAADSESREGWMIGLGLVAVISFFAWMGNFRRGRLIADTPTSRIASAAQGFVELVGSGNSPNNAPLFSRLTRTPCLWYAFLVERRNSDNKWVVEERGQSEETFIITDGSGECVVDPDGAEVMTRDRHTWREGDHRYTERLLVPMDTIYVLGEFISMGGAGSVLDLRRDVGERLAEWKRDTSALLHRFDKNGDGSLDLVEWEAARREAVREVQAEHRDIRARDAVHMMRRPRDGRPYLLANLAPESLARKYRFWGAFHLTVLFGGVGGLAALMFNPGWFA